MVIFIADGADPVSITATRIRAGQQKGMTGEKNVLSYETFPNVALVKTYTTDSQVADSAPTATAWNSGVKSNNGVIGVNEQVQYDDCASQRGNDVTTIFGLAELAGMATGTVSTARLTYITLGFPNGPGSIYYAVPNEDGTLPEGSGRAPKRPNPADDRVQNKDYLQQATGPHSYLVRGVIEQNYLFQVMNYALNLTERARTGR